MPRSLAVALLVFVAGGILAPHAGAASQATPPPGSQLTPLVWQWTALELADGTTETPADPAIYTLQFLSDGRYLVRADCNGGSGEYAVDGQDLQLSPPMITLIACPAGSLADVYLQRLAEVVSFAYDDEELVLALADDGGLLRFTAALTGVVWEWQGFQGGDGSEVVPDDPARYTILFLQDGSVAVQADCNRGTGSYTVDGSQIAIDEIVTTLIGCPSGSLGPQFLGYLAEAVSFVVRDGGLHLSLPADAGIATFAPRVIEEDAATPVAG